MARSGRRRGAGTAWVALWLGLIAGPVQAQVRLAPVAADPALAPLDVVAGGRVRPVAGGWLFQWPGVRFEAGFSGESVVVRLGAGPQTLAVRIDGVEVWRLVAPEPGDYRLSGLTPGEHRIRIEMGSENQAGPVAFGGLFGQAPGRQSPTSAVSGRQIEVIGDSHSVGYGVRSERRACSPREIWETTDTHLAYGALTAARFGADLQVNAISGRGMVRNYAGFDGPTLPQAYPFDLFDQSRRYDDPDWRPQVVVVNLGTNDFSTALGAGEPWSSREALRADFTAGYVAFVRGLRARRPDALFVLLAPPSGEGEILAGVTAAGERLAARGDRHVAVLPLPEMRLTACDGHPSIDDQRGMAETLSDFLADRPDVWSH